MRKKLLLSAAYFLAIVALGAACSVASASTAEIKLARHPDYHGAKIVFSYLGNLWLVDEDGSNPRRLTVQRARDTHPRFSPDGKWIAFSSSRYGNYDVFVIPVAQTLPRQLRGGPLGDGYRAADFPQASRCRPSRRTEAQ